MKNCALICNLVSGRGIKLTKIDEVVNLIKKYNYSVTKYITKNAGDATNIVKNLNNADLVLSLGGDGTFNEVVTGNYQRKNKLLLSHIPTGTTNDIGVMWGLKKNDISNNLKEIMNGEIKNIDVLTLNDEPFVYVAGFGKFMNVTYETSHKIKKNLGYLGYMSCAVKEFCKKTPLFELEYEIDGVKYSGSYSILVISNSNRIAGFNNFYKNIKLDDNKFEVLLSTLYSKKDIIKTVTTMKRKDVSNINSFKYYQTDNLKIKFKKTPSTAWSIDGEKYYSDNKEYKISIIKNIKMLLPKKNISSLFVN